MSKELLRLAIGCSKTGTGVRRPEPPHQFIRQISYSRFDLVRDSNLMKIEAGILSIASDTVDVGSFFASDGTP